MTTTEVFGTAYDVPHFSLYYDDINERMKKRRPDVELLTC